jgi:anti-sigma factor RsiW
MLVDYEAQAGDEFPRVSLVTVQSAANAASSSTTSIAAMLPTVHASVTARERETFVATLPTRVQTKLNQPFGKDNIVQCFMSEASLRHVLLPLYKSMFLLRELD